MDPVTAGLLGLGLYSALSGDQGDQGDESGVDMGSAAPGYSIRVQALARAIATAEGFFVPGSIPARAHNPGNLVIPGWTGPTLGAERISVFDSDDEGWSRLYRQIGLIVSGQSRVYTLDMTIAQMGNAWAPGGNANIPGAWATNVARVLGVPVSTTLRAIL